MANAILTHRDNVIDDLRQQGEGALAKCRSQTIGDGTWVQLGLANTTAERARRIIRTRRLHAHHTRSRAGAACGQPRTREQAPATYRHEQQGRLYTSRIRFEHSRPLPRNHRSVIVRMHQRGASRRHHGGRSCFPRRQGRFAINYPAAFPQHQRTLRGGGVRRHDDSGGYAGTPRRSRQGGGMVARRMGHHAACRHGGRQRQHGIRRPTGFEGTNSLQVFALEDHAGATLGIDEVATYQRRIHHLPGNARGGGVDGCGVGNFQAHHEKLQISPGKTAGGSVGTKTAINANGDFGTNAERHPTRASRR